MEAFMSSNTIGDIIQSKSKEVDLFVAEISILKQLIKESANRFDLVRELLSNSGSKQVDSNNIEISYTKDKEGHIYEIKDDGCGMSYTGNNSLPGRLDKFLGLGLSGIIGLESDEFSWKGLGSKLSFQSRRVEIETYSGDNHDLYDVRINEPWDNIDRNLKPKPRISFMEKSQEKNGTKIRVVGYQPHHQHDEPFTMEEIKNYILHRTFVGYTKKREKTPAIQLSVLGETETLNFGFPEFRDIDFDNIDKLKLDEDSKTLFININSNKSKQLNISVKGFITWDDKKYNLSKDNLNTGLILSVKGIPYFNLNMQEYGVKSILTARPGENKTCIIIECDSIHDEMNISRSGLNDSKKTLEFKKNVCDIFYDIEKSDEYLTFRKIPESDKHDKQGDILIIEKNKINSNEQNWVVYDDKSKGPTILIREPKFEVEVNALIWKLEALGALPFEKFNTLAYIGASKGPDLLVNFQEEKSSEFQMATVIEIEHNFYNYKTHGHIPIQYPKVICWDIPQSGRKIKLKSTSKKYKFTYSTDEYQVHIFVLRLMDNIKLLSKEELLRQGINIL
jgi:hypothetical protein